MQGKHRGGKQHPNSLANLRPPWKPGEIPNPTGISRKRPITDHYYERAESPVPEKLREKINALLGEELLEPGATWAQANALRRFVSAVMEANGTADSKEIREAIEGKAPQRIELSGPERKEITIRVIHQARKLPSE